MDRVTEATTSWAQALSWRLDRQLLSPVGSESVGAVVRRLGAVLAMDESLAELAVGTRRESSHMGDLAAALAAGEVVKAFAFRGAVHYLSPEDGGTYLVAPLCRSAVGAEELGGPTTGSRPGPGPTSGPPCAKRSPTDRSPSPSSGKPWRGTLPTAT